MSTALFPNIKVMFKLGKNLKKTFDLFEFTEGKGNSEYGFGVTF